MEAELKTDPMPSSSFVDHDMRSSVRVVQNYDALTVSGGGTKGVLFLGALQYFCEIGSFVQPDIKEYSGSSIGSAICLLLICGYTPKEIFDELKDDIGKFINFENANMLNMLNTYGLTQNTLFIERLTNLVVAKVGKIPTMKELFEMTHVMFIVCITNYTKMCEEIYTHETKPNLSCINAVKISCNLPFVFGRIKYNGDYVGDGGVLNNVPHKYISEHSRKMLCLVTSGDDQHTDADTLYSYFYKLMMTPITYITDIHCGTIRPSADLVKIHYAKGAIQKSVTLEDAMEMFSIGYESAKTQKGMGDSGGDSGRVDVEDCVLINDEQR